MRSEAIALPVHVVNAAAALSFFHLVIVQTGFSDGNNTRQAAFLNQVGDCGFVDVFVVWVNANRAPKIIVGLGQGVHIIKLFHGGADAQSTGDLRILHFLANVWQLR